MDDGTEVVGLIGEATFSSAIINAVELQEMGIPLVGEPASGSVDHFGSVSGFSLPNSGIQIGVSSKYIDLGTLLDADAGRGVESLEPDIAVPQTMADTLAGRDTAVEWLLAIRRRWNSGNTRMRRSPGGGSWGCCMLRPGPLPQRRRPVSRICWASSGSCRR